MRWKYCLGQILRDNWDNVLACGKFNSFQLRHLHQLKQCRTELLGGHVLACENCGYYKISYNSCRNRHCPTCQGTKREEWIARQEAQLLDVPYFHVVFTLPEELNGLCLAYPRLIYKLLFDASWQTIQAFASDPKFLGAKTGMTAVLHTWSQSLMLHPHLHCIVPGGGITKIRKWKTTRTKGKYLFPRNALRKVFKGKFMAGLKDLTKSGAIVLLHPLKEKLYSKNWVVYAKRPFLGPKAVIEYLGRYTHKVAISNYRIKSVDKQKISFEWKDYKAAGKKKIMSLSIIEFIRRFCLHLLPDSFQRIRHYGILSSRGRACFIPELQIQMELDPYNPSKEQIRQLVLQRMKIGNTCPCCQVGKMQIILPFGRDGPPGEVYIQQYIYRKGSIV